MSNKESGSDIKEEEAKEYVRVAYLQLHDQPLIFTLAQVGWMVARWEWERGCMAQKEQE